MQAPEPSDITRCLADMQAGRAGAAERLYPLIYERLRRLACAQMREQRPGHTLQPTALVHEAFLRLVGQDGASYQDRAHFFAVSATAMRRALIDHARTRTREKRGGDRSRIAIEAPEVEAAVVGADARGLDLLALDEALERLGALDERKARIVELRFFAGLTTAETAAALGVSEKTVKRDWAVAKGWLHRELAGAEKGRDDG